MSTAPPMTTRELDARLERHYIPADAPFPGGVFLPEVTYGGAGGSRCDALYVGFTTTSGRILIGHEVKTSRGDWLRELATPGKADAWADECHAWYVVAPDTQIVRPEELPDGWGLMTPGNARTRLTVTVRARVHADRVPSWTAVRSLLARADTLRAEAIRRGIDEGERKVREAYDERLKDARAQTADVRTRERADRAEGLLRAVEHALGVTLSLDEGASTRPYGHSYVHPDALRRLAPALAADTELARLASRYRDRMTGLASVARDVENLEAAIRAAAAPVAAS